VLTAPNRTTNHRRRAVEAAIMRIRYDKSVTAESPAHHGIDCKRAAPYMAAS
jgi:hypothetical protein